MVGRLPAECECDSTDVVVVCGGDECNYDRQ